MGVITENKVHDKGKLCDCLIHPFQDDPGASQQQREMEELMGDRSKIDARKMADLLDFFYQLSMQINYHDNNLLISDWRPFFEKSIPFILASVIRHKVNRISKQFEQQCKAFEQNPGREGLQLAQLFLFYNTLKPVADWYAGIKGSRLPVERVFENIIKDKIARPLISFISLNLLSANKFSIKAIDFNKGFQDDIWGLRDSQEIPKRLKADKQKIAAEGDCESLLWLHKQTKELFNTFFGQLSTLGRAAEQSLELSFVPLGEEMKQKHLPHLALLFAFLKLFQQLQGQLNGFTKKHLDYFYKEVLKLAPRHAMADKAHLVFAIQKELDNYRIEKGVEVRDGLDANKEDILFALDEEIVVNQAQVKEVRTLHVNNLLLPDRSASGDEELNVVVEGVYMATDATKADGIDKEFQSEIRNFYTLGNKRSKYILPETKGVKPYETARLGFILASTVLLLEGGKRKVEISLKCIHDENVCKDQIKIDNPDAQKCCEPVSAGTVSPPVLLRPVLPAKIVLKKPVSIFLPPLALIGKIEPSIAGKPDLTLVDSDSLSTKSLQAGEVPSSQRSIDNILESVNDAINLRYYYVSQELITAARKKGLNEKAVKSLKELLQTSNEEEGDGKKKPYCFCPSIEEKYDAVIPKELFESSMDMTLDVIKEFFTVRSPFKLSFSGEKKWIVPGEGDSTSFAIVKTGGTNTFDFTIKATIDADKEPIVFYDKEKLGEDFNTELPLVKIELDDHFKMAYPFTYEDGSCCLRRTLSNQDIPFSLYHFFRDVRIDSAAKIKVEVCGLKKMIVQNDESIMDVNGPVFPFGARPKITSNFYIGSKEVFCKNWEEVVINFCWKNKPPDLKAYYHGYEDILTGIKSEDFDDLKFMYQAGALKDGTWFDYNERRYLFIPDLDTSCRNSSEVLESCEKDKLFKENLVRRECIRFDFIHTEFIKPELLNEDGSVKGEAIGADNSLLASSFKDNIVEQAGNPPEDYIPVKCLNVRYSYRFKSADFDSLGPLNRAKEFFQPEPFTFTARNGFFRITLELQDFQHSRYSYVLARQMMADGKLPNVYIGPVYDGVNLNATKIEQLSFDELFKTVVKSSEIARNIDKRLAGDPGILKDFLDTYIHGGSPGNPPYTGANFSFPIDFDQDDFNNVLGNPLPGMEPNPVPSDFLKTLPEEELDKYRLRLILNKFNDPFLDEVATKIKEVEKTRVVIPNEPYTPQITELDIDYTANAEAESINLIHVYPYRNTHKEEQIKSKPTLLPSFCHEGNLYLGLEKLVPGTNLNILFQLAEATSDAEEDKEDVFWYYLDNNIWKALRPGFEVVEDNTHNLTTTGIIKFALPENMTNTNTVMPAGLHWIRASIPKNSRSVSETTAICTQAVRATFTNTPANDKLRLGKPIAKEQLTKLEVADASVKQVKQPFETFGGQVPEEQGLFYVRVSEMLRHKGRGIQKFDYERIVLNAFPELYRAKCINHSFGLNANLYKNDFPYAPGYILMAVIPDLTKMTAGESYEPKAPASLLERIEAYVRRRISPFVRFRVMNPRYEKVNLCLKVKLVKGKDEVYYKERLKEDLRKFLAPWTIGDQYLFKLAFGACVNRSTIIGFIESLEYIDFIGELRIRHESEEFYADNSADMVQVCPKTPRSILVGGNIEICILEDYCEEWEKCTDRDRSKCCDKKEPVSLICKPVEPSGKGVIL